MNQVAERYAQAFFSLAADEKKVAELKDQAADMLSVVDRDVIKFLETRAIAKSDKKALLKDVLKGADRDFVNFMSLLVDSGRSHYIVDILKSFISQCNEELKIQEVTVVSARELTEKETAEIAEAIGKKLGKKVEITNKIDKTLLAGTRIYINDRVYDSSLKARVNSLREELLKESW
ncbi:MAG: ATP synthase F1 subunit delta [Clostridiales bacterium]|nr:ATP synthase F1 subunit delta [Erysipelotrichaceae bacterium]MBR4484389.1 ATP synthase F1 subunit delta [Erysipelotrichaceae bacterium]MBR6253881.1 ATP synthase F1 subunit delta [Clostridiales bacterium]MDO5438627.1 ATP synthase F1 subunit delta [Erysipelotrichaceae bacterium]